MAKMGKARGLQLYSSARIRVHDPKTLRLGSLNSAAPLAVTRSPRRRSALPGELPVSRRRTKLNHQFRPMLSTGKDDLRNLQPVSSQSLPA